MKTHEIGSKKHFTEEQRMELLGYLSRFYSIPKIAEMMGFNKTSIYREIILNSVVENKHGMVSFGLHLFKNCKNITKCKEKGITKCPKICMKYMAKTCPRITKPYQICNFCERKLGCKFERFVYHPEKAHDIAKERFKAPRGSLKLDKQQLRQFDEYFSFKVINGQSPEVIKSYSNDKDFPVCSKTARNYIRRSLLSCNLLDLHRQVRYKKSYNYSQKRSYSKNPLIKLHHMFSDYIEYARLHPELDTFEVDTVHGKISDNKTLLTIHNKKLHFQYYVLLNKNKTEVVNEAFRQIINTIGQSEFSRVFGLLLCDNGSEFDNITKLEINEYGEQITKIFYTRAYKSSDKSECERNHELFRYIRSKGISFADLNNEDVYKINCHINSYPRQALNWKSPLEAMIEKYGPELMEKLGVRQIERKSVVLKYTLINK